MTQYKVTFWRHSLNGPSEDSRVFDTQEAALRLYNELCKFTRLKRKDGQCFAVQVPAKMTKPAC